MSRFLLLALIAAASAPSFAQWRDGPPAPRSEVPRTLQRATFGALDTDYNFVLSREEAAASRLVALNFENGRR